jgi:hypothetical protein
MTSHRILQLNAVSTAACGLAMLATRATLHAFFGLDTPTLLDLLAVGFLLYAGALAVAARRQPVSREVLIAFTVADGLWVVASAMVLLLFWGQLAAVARGGNLRDPAIPGGRQGPARFAAGRLSGLSVPGTGANPWGREPRLTA